MRKDPTSRTLLFLVGVGLFAWAVYSIRWALPPFFIGFTFAVLLDPLVDSFEKRRVPRGAAVFLVFLIFLALFSAMAFPLPLIFNQAVEFFGEAPQIFEDMRGHADAWLAGHQEFLNRVGLPLNVEAALDQYREQISGLVQGAATGAMGWVQASLARMAWVIITPIITLYFLVDIDRIRTRLIYLIPDETREGVLEITRDIGKLLVQYVRGLILVCFGQGIVVWLALQLGFNLPYALLVGLVAGVLYAVPYIGFLLTLILGLVIAWSTGYGIGYMVGVGLTLAALNQIFDLLITPRVIGGQVGLHPVASLFALMVGGGLFGLPGMLLAVPVAASIRVVISRFYPRMFEPIPEQNKTEPSADVTPEPDQPTESESDSGSDPD